MVVPLGPGKFYGSSLPRPRIYTDVKFNSDRVDPPVPVTDPLLSWAQEAHWSMGGLSFQRLRLQGRIEGSVGKLRKLREKEAKLQSRNSPKDQKGSASSRFDGKKNDNGKRARSVSPPPAPKVSKRRRYMDLFDEESEDDGQEHEEVVQKMKMRGSDKKKKSVRKLVGDFEKVATESVVNDTDAAAGIGGTGATAGAVGVRRSSRGVGAVVMKVVEEINKENSAGKIVKRGKNDKVKDHESSPVNGVRTSPRLAKQRAIN